ncbi:hypothetical protein, partial [Mycobacterium avium]
RRISAQSSTVITLQSKGAHFSTGITCSLFDRNRQSKPKPWEGLPFGAPLEKREPSKLPDGFVDPFAKDFVPANN